MTLPAGWLTEDEADALRRLARNTSVLELGAWKGRSTVALSETAAYVISVDRHKGIAEVGGEDSLPDYLASVRSLSNVAIVVASFDEFLPFLATEEFGLVFIDGDHDEDSVYRDTRDALRCVGDGCHIAFHDWDFESVRTGVHRVLGEERQPDGLVGSVAWFEV